METVNVHDAKSNLSKLLARVERGEEIVIARAGKPVAKLIPIPPHPGKRPLGLLKGQIVMLDDFDDPLPDEFWNLDAPVFPDEDEGGTH